MYDLEKWIPKSRGFSTDLEKFFGDIFKTPLFQREDYFCPTLNLKEDESQYTFTVELPGANKDNVQIEYQDGILSISGERKKETSNQTEKFHRYEIATGKFQRSFELPDVESEKIEASFKDGILTITAPKQTQTIKKAKQITIK
jgi:HSP20 family protein